MKPAGYGARITAALLDLIIVGIGTTVLAWPFLKLMHYDERLKDVVQVSQSIESDPYNPAIDPSIVKNLLVFSIALLALTLVLLLAMHCYYVLLEASASGQTLGKKLLGLRVIDVETGGRITRTQAVYREALRWYVDGLFILPAFIAMFATARRQRVGDLAAKTMVIEVSPT